MKTAVELMSEGGTVVSASESGEENGLYLNAAQMAPPWTGIRCGGKTGKLGEFLGCEEAKERDQQMD